MEEAEKMGGSKEGSNFGYAKPTVYKILGL